MKENVTELQVCVEFMKYCSHNERLASGAILQNANWITLCVTDFSTIFIKETHLKEKEILISDL